MLRTIVSALLREAYRHPRYVGLNVLGLTLGLGVFLLLSQFVRHEYRFNSTIADADRIVRVDMGFTLPGRAPYETNGLSFYALPFLREDFPDLYASTLDRTTDVLLQASGRRLTRRIDQVDSAYLKTIPLALQQGDPQTALDRPDSIILSARTALALFGTVGVLGRTIDVDENGERTTTSVTAVLAPPLGPVTIDPDALMIVPSPVRQTYAAFSRWNSEEGRVYLRFRTVSDMRRERAQLAAFLIRRATGLGGRDDDRSLGLQPERTHRLSFVTLRQMHFQDLGVQNATDGADRTVVDSLGLIGLLVLVLAVANSVNLATARAGLRAREIAMRKTLGATRSQLFVQFMGEALLLAACAGLGGLSLCELLLPVMAAVTGATLGGEYGLTVATLAAAVLVAGVGAGLYPALLLSSYRPARVLAASRIGSGGRHAGPIRNMLVLTQFVLAVLIAICTLVVNRQASFVRNADPGFDRQGLLISPQIPARDAVAQHRMLDALRTTPGALAATLSVLEPRIDNRNIFTTQQPGGRRVHVLTDVVSGEYRQVYRPGVLAGRWFDTRHGRDDSSGTDGLERDPGPRDVILNLRAVMALGFDRPAAAIGQSLRIMSSRLHIIGVVDDTRFVSPHEPVEPLVVFYSTKALSSPVVTVRFAGVTAQVMQGRVKAVWDRLLPDIDGTFERVEDRTSSFYDADQRRGYLFAAGSAVAVLIACVGLYGLAAFAAARRRHEVGIRKALGATTTDVVLLMLREFLAPVWIACAIACPLAWAAMRYWLATFAQRITLSPLDFLVVVAGAVLIATLTVVGQTLRVARAEPARALRTE